MSRRCKKNDWDCATDWLPAEVLYWLSVPGYPPVWSRLSRYNAGRVLRDRPESKSGVYDIEIPRELWSLWGYLHPLDKMFNLNACSKQSWACSIMACCAATLYPLAHWTPRLMDAIIINGDNYYRNSLRSFDPGEYLFTLNDFKDTCKLENLQFKVHTELIAFGALYEENNSPIMNLAKGLITFFSQYRVGLLHCRHQRAVVIGRDNCNGCVGGDYFMYDCQSRDFPLFRKGEGVPYLLRCKTLHMLLYCLVMALAVRCKRVQFTLHKVEVRYKGSVNDDQDGDCLRKAMKCMKKGQRKLENTNYLRIRGKCNEQSLA
uniref:Uncharacterized protein n=1 Tax=Ceratitis capitata TaxID=7213 RepID=W8C167_CERCA